MDKLITKYLNPLYSIDFQLYLGIEMKEQIVKETHNKRWLKLLLKIAITAVCLWYVSRRIDFSKIWITIRAAYWPYLLLALPTFILSKLVSAIRLNIYFQNIGLSLATWQNVKLYWLGMFYNLFLPGSISGDVYKIVMLKRSYNTTYKKTSAAVLLDRFSGLLGLGLILAAYSIFVVDKATYVITITGGVILAGAALYYIIHRWLKDFIPGFIPTFLLGIVVQVLQVICIYIVMAALGITSNAAEYIFIFLVSSVASVLPFTIGGLGIREVIFLEGSKLFGLAQETSVLISLLFYLITVLTSAAGLLYVFNDPLEKNKDSLLSP